MKKSDWIHWPPQYEIKKYLISQGPEAREQINNLPLQGHYGDNFRLAFPYRDRKGVITGFLKRAIFPEGITINGHKGIRWDSTYGLKKKDLFNLHNCKGHDHLIILEGCPDALYLPALGFNNVVATGQGAFSKAHLEGLFSFGVKSVVLAFDNDPLKEAQTEGEGVKNTKKALEHLSGTGITAFVLDPGKLGKYKDPDEIINGKKDLPAQGIGVFKELGYFCPTPRKVQ